MSIRLAKIGAYAASSLLAITLAVGVSPVASASASPVSPNTITGHETGNGPTLSAAETDATNQMYNDFYGCSQPYLVSDGQNTDGSWWARMAATCKGAY